LILTRFHPVSEQGDECAAMQVVALRQPAAGALRAEITPV